MAKVLVLYQATYGHVEQMTLGATTIAGRDGARQPSAHELAGARYQGRKIAEVARQLHG